MSRQETEGRGDSWVEALSSTITGLASNETLSELASQALTALAELRAADPQKQAKGGAEPSGREPDAGPDGAEAPSGERGRGPGPGRRGGGGRAAADLSRRLDALSACVEELTDLLDAGLERMETVEMQLGDPEDNVAAEFTAALGRCEARLAAIEHRLAHAAAGSGARQAAPDAGGRGRAAGRVPQAVALVVDPDSARRCALCVALERQGLRCWAVAGTAGVAARLARWRPDVVLIDAGAGRNEAAGLAAALGGESDGGAVAPAVLVVTPRIPGRAEAASMAETFGPWPLVTAAEGEAALAAAVLEHVKPAAAGRDGDDLEDSTEEATPYVCEGELRGGDREQDAGRYDEVGGGGCDRAVTAELDGEMADEAEQGPGGAARRDRLLDDGVAG